MKVFVIGLFGWLGWYFVLFLKVFGYELVGLDVVFFFWIEIVVSVVDVVVVGVVFDEYEFDGVLYVGVLYKLDIVCYV